MHARRPGSRRQLVLVVVAVALVSACTPVWMHPIDALTGSLDAGSVLIGCDQATAALTVTVSSHLDPSCVYTGGVTITESNVTFDCRGAHIEGLDGTGRGILVTAPTTVALAHVVVRNCFVRNFLNNVRVSRAGFKSLAPGSEYDQAFSDIVIEHSHLYESKGSGVFVDGYVTGVTLRDLEVSGSGSVGIYLEAGSKGTTVSDSVISWNGWGDVSDAGVPITIAGHNYRYHSTGREGIAVDGSRDNVITGNTITGNSYGGIFLYKNCGEFATQKPAQWWERRYGADGNLIEGNHIAGEPNGVWIGSRMTENQYFMDCSDPAYVSDTIFKAHRDYAKHNIVRNNWFDHVGYGVRVEDDDNTVDANTFSSTEPGQLAVLVGTWWRSELLAEPTTGTVVTANAASLPDTAAPYVTIPSETATTFVGNTTYGDPATLEAGTQPTVSPALFAIDIWSVP